MVDTTDGDHRRDLNKLCSTLLSEHPLILASNRGPVEHHVNPDGSYDVRKGSGGVVTALNSLRSILDFTWIASAMGEGDRRIASENVGQKVRSHVLGQKMDVRYVNLPRSVYHKHYNIFCNPLLWFLQHYMWNSPYNPNIDSTVHDAWKTGYIPVNEEFGRAIVEEGRKHSGRPIVMIHDYHLYLTPGFVRERLPNAIIQHFTHIPWPDPRYWKLLPDYMRTQICQSLTASDYVGFQSIEDVRNFLDSCEEFLPNASVDHNKRCVHIDGRLSRVRAYPISVNVDEIVNIANSSRAVDYENSLRNEIIGKVIVRVDRAEPSKNIVRGFNSFALLLTRYPELQKHVTFLAFLVPSRTHVRQYRRYLEEIKTVVSDINSSFGDENWKPIKCYIENNYTQAIAGMKLYDVLLVNSVIDGMNLVAKEGPLVNTKNGVLILSDTTGAHHELKEGALSVSPADIEGTMYSMYRALTMKDNERLRRSEQLTDRIRSKDIIYWLVSQFEDIRDILDRT